MTLHDRTTKSLLHLHKKKKPPSISAQFQTSLNKLLETLGKAEPFFIRCIRSNAAKKELCFDDELVLQQLRYTGMLETVRIRRSGYSAKYTFQDFTEQFQVLLPKDAQPCREVISALLEKMHVDKRSYQIGKTKVFLKEMVRQTLQETLHREVLRKILLLQSWVRTALERRHFLQLRRAAVAIQACWRSYSARRALERTQAAVCLQAAWRGYRQRRAYHRWCQSIIRLQSLCRGHLQRRSFSQMLAEKQREEEQSRESQEASVMQDTEAGQGLEATEEQVAGQEVEAAGDSEHTAPGPKAQPEDGSPVPGPETQPEDGSPAVAEVAPGPGNGSPAPRSTAVASESQEKAASSREKRESRRQRGLEHVELQNRHMQASREELRAGDVDSRSGDAHHGPQPEASPSPLPQEAAGTPGDPAQDPGPSPPQRPTSLALDMVPKDRSQLADSPGAAVHIQRYQPAEGERLAIAVEQWRGRKLGAVVLSQSLDLGDKHRAAGSASSPTEERRISLSTDDISKLSPAKAQPSAETDGEPSTKKPVVHKKKSGDISSGLDAGVSPGSQADSKSTFKRLFLHKTKDKKSSLEGVEETETTVSRHAALEATTVKKNLEAPSGHQPHHTACEKHTKDAGSKGKKNRNLKIGKITVTEKWRESVFRKITNANELKYLDEFLLNKINDLRSQKTPIESLFIEATERFRSNLKTMYSVPNGKVHVGYKDLMENYQIIVSNLASERGEDTNLVLNLFQSLLDEFTRRCSKNDFDPVKPSKAQKKKQKQERAVQEHKGHVFASYQVSIPQSCEHCLSFIWLMDKALLCSVCKMTCHKKCVHKIQNCCSYLSGRKSEPGAELGHFGVCVDSLTNDKTSVPLVLEKLLEHVELHGLYTEGLYRKSGTAHRTRELRQALQTDPAAVRLEDFPIHAITGVLKQWLRELPEPLMTFAQYSDFLRAVELPGKQEQLAAIYAVLELLPKANHDSLERLVFHLVKVALLEDVNRMSPGALAIIFAPCLLRCPDNSDPLTSMKDVLKITTCVEMLIKEQMRKYKVKMKNINQLEAEESIVCRRLSLLQQTEPWPFKLSFSSPCEGVLSKSPKISESREGDLEELEALTEEEVAGGGGSSENQEKEMLMERIQSLKEEKEDITYRLPELDPRGSDEENLDSETSASTESLLEERAGRGASEGPPVPVPPHPTTPAPSPLPAAAPPRRRPASFAMVRVKTPRRTPVMPTANIKLPPGLSCHLPSREPPARRPDQVRSVYIAPGLGLLTLGALEPLDEHTQPTGAKRRYSDPPTYCLPPTPGQAPG